MRIVGLNILHGAIHKNPELAGPVYSWAAEIEEADWKNPHQLKERFPSASIIGGSNVVFNIKGNQYRLWTEISYEHKLCCIRKFGDHQDYNKWSIK